MGSTERINKLVKEAGEFNSRLAKRLSPFNLDFLVWVSPSSCRDPEETKLWHPFYAKKSLMVKTCAYLYFLFLYSFVGLVRFFTYKGFYYNCSGKKSRFLLVIPDDITDHTKEAGTDYLIEDADYPVAKLVFSRSKKIGYRYCNLTYTAKFRIFIRLLSTALGDLKKRSSDRRLNAEYLDAFMMFLRWVISQSWQFHWDFYYLLKQALALHFSDSRTLLCLHEMHFYSRVIWKVAGEKGLLGITAQHAMIVPEKLWYFPDTKEIEVDCPRPDIFFVYSDEIKNMLQPFYPGTKFLLCCSPRFSKWKAISPGPKRGTLLRDNAVVTFVGGIMRYDVTILLQGIKSLLNRRKDAQGGIVLRLHPHGTMDMADRMWIRFASAANKIRISRAPLKEDLTNSSLIVGSNSTVLQEAVLLGVPALGVFHKNFVSHSILPDSKEWYVCANMLSWDRVKEQSHKRPDGAIIDRFRKNMGLFNPDFTTCLIYETCEIG